MSISATAVYKFHCDCGRNGSLEGVFIAKKTSVENLFGTKVYFGDVLGKYSDVEVTILPQHIRMITDDPSVIDLFMEHDISSGYNPLDYDQETE
jgi:hypothetical protein